MSHRAGSWFAFALLAISTGLACTDAPRPVDAAAQPLWLVDVKWTNGAAQIVSITPHRGHIPAERPRLDQRPPHWLELRAASGELLSRRRVDFFTAWAATRDDAACATGEMREQRTTVSLLRRRAW